MAISLYELAQRVNSAMPLGTIVPYYGTDEPSGWKICDGRSCAGTDLAKKLGISVVPDLRGRFIRMIGGNAAGMAVAQGDLVGNHTHTIPLWGGQGRTEPNSVCSWDNNWRNGEYKATLSGAVENRPINMAFNYIIKVVGTNVILYYVSNIIYKAKAHICRTFSFVKSFQREVRNSMSISLKNIEDRVKALENKASSTGGIVESKMTDPGYIKFSTGMILQWAGYNNHKFCIPFPNKCLIVMTGSRDYMRQGDKSWNSDLALSSLSTSSFATYDEQAKHIAIGYLITYRLLNIYYAYAHKVTHNCLHFLMRFLCLNNGRC